jgi:hypothetical protein
MMARFVEPAPRELKIWHEWLASRPAHIRVVAEAFDPWSLYRLKESGHRVFIEGVGENTEEGVVTLTVVVSGAFNRVAFDRVVYGIPPDGLEPCALPEPGEPLGTLLTPEEVEKNIDLVRATARPDLFVLDEAGSLHRKH